MTGSGFVRTILLWFLISAFAFAQTSYGWDPQSGTTGNWDVPTNWSPTGIPGPGDMIGNITVNDTIYTNGAREVASLSSNGTIILSGAGGALTITGSATWLGGIFRDATPGGNGVITIASGATFNTLNGMVSGCRLAGGITLLNQGTILANIGFIAHDSSTVVNEGLFAIDGDIFFGSSGPFDGTIINSGVVRKISGTSASSFSPSWKWINQNGEFDVRFGTLQLSGEGRLTGGTYNAEAGARLIFTTSDYFLEGTLSGSPAGSVELDLIDAYVGPAGAVLDFQGNGIRWSGADFTGGGTVTIPPGALMVSDPGSANQIKGGTTLLNEGTLRVEANFTAIEGSVVDNRGTVDLAGTFAFVNSSGIFLNSGTLLQSAGSGTSSFTQGWEWINQNGVIHVQSGTLQIRGRGTFIDGTYNADAGAVLRFNSSDTLFFSGTLSGSPAGEVELAGGSEIHIDPSGIVLDFEGMGIQWRGADFTGGGTVTIPQGTLMRVLPGSTNLIEGSTTLLNEGTIQVEANFAPVGGSATIDNRGLLDIVGNINLGNGNGILQNSGTVRKSAGTLTSPFGTNWDWVNLAGGIIDAVSGELRFHNLQNRQGGIIQGTETVYLPSGFINDGIVSPGNSAGNLRYRLDYAPSATGVLEIELGGLTPGLDYDQLAVNRSAALNGTLNVSLINGFVPAVGDSFVVLTTGTGVVSDSFSTVNVPAGLFLKININPENVTLIVDSVAQVGIEDEPSAGTDRIPTTTVLQQNYPNPFNPQTTISFQLATTGRVHLAIYDIQGRRVKQLSDGSQQPAGNYQVRWNGIDDVGRQVAGGVYFYRLQTAEFSETKKLLLIR